jgi:hypothetical protein
LMPMHINSDGDDDKATEQSVAPAPGASTPTPASQVVKPVAPSASATASAPGATTPEPVPSTAKSVNCPKCNNSLGVIVDGGAELCSCGAVVDHTGKVIA